MNNQNQQINNAGAESQTTLRTEPQLNNNYVEKNRSFIVDVLTKLYSNKLAFWVLVVFLIIVLFVVIVGSLFGAGNKPKQIFIPKATKIPFILLTPDPTPSVEILSTSQEKINLLKKQVEELDVRQNRLQPPNISFDIKF